LTTGRRRRRQRAGGLVKLYDGWIIVTTLYVTGKITRGIIDSVTT
jgi:hypothetical protein